METNEMNDTPETDTKTHDVGDSTECLMVSAEVARKLERERDELIHAVKALKAAKGRFHTQQAATNLFNLLP